MSVNATDDTRNPAFPEFRVHHHAYFMPSTLTSTNSQNQNITKSNSRTRENSRWISSMPTGVSCYFSVRPPSIWFRELHCVLHLLLPPHRAAHPSSTHVRHSTGFVELNRCDTWEFIRALFMTFQPDTFINEAFAPNVQHFHSWHPPHKRDSVHKVTSSLLYLWTVGPPYPH